MSNNTRAWVAGVVVVVAVAAFAAWYYTRVPEPFAPSASDHISSWALPLPQDAASSTPRLTTQIQSFSKMLGGGAYPDEDIYVGIANDYMLTGDGKSAFNAYERAISASSTYAIAYDDLGGLFARIHATSSAERAYAQAITLAPSELLYRLTYLDYLAQVAPSATTTAAAFASAKQAIGASDPDLLVAEANWLTGIGSTTAAIADWEIVRGQVGAAQQAQIDAGIAALRAHMQ